MKQASLKIVMGVDVSKDKLDTCVVEVLGDLSQKIKSSRSFENSPSGIKNLEKYWKSKSQTHPNALVVMEPTGTYHENLAYSLHNQGFIVCIELANKIKHFSKSLNIKSKTDRSDAVVIARYGAQNSLEEWTPFSESELHLKQLTRLILSAKKSMITLKNRKHALSATSATMDDILSFVQRELDFYSSYVNDLKQQIEELILSDEKLKRKVDIIISIPGVSITTAAAVIAETGGFQTFKNVRSLVSYAGLDVAQNESGTITKKTHISKRG